MRSSKFDDPDLPPLLPFQPGPASNGEFVPFDPSPHHLRMAALAQERAEAIAHKQGIDRRAFLLGLGGLAVTLGRDQHGRVRRRLSRSPAGRTTRRPTARRRPPASCSPAMSSSSISRRIM